jgi:RNA polymerase sigma factor (sigma-70 family)
MQRFGSWRHRRGVTDNDRTDAELLTGLRVEPELVAVLFDRHAAAVFRFLARRAGSAAAEDLLSEVFAAALDARKRVVAHHSGSALPWLYGIALNVLRRHLRTLAQRHIVTRDPGMDWDAVDARLDAQAHRSQLRAALRDLSSGERDVLLLVAWEGLTPTEAAQVLGISKVAARSRLHRARQRAQHTLTADLSDGFTALSTLLIREENPT